MNLQIFEKYRGQCGIHSFTYQGGVHERLIVKYDPGQFVPRPVRDQILVDCPGIAVDFVAEEAEAYTNMDIFDK